MTKNQFKGFYAGIRRNLKIRKRYMAGNIDEIEIQFIAELSDTFKPIFEARRLGNAYQYIRFLKVKRRLDAWCLHKGYGTTNNNQWCSVSDIDRILFNRG